jgi:class 3 adenylate cyclase/tetratricopeptide (TPR) repeat protein
MDLEGWLRSLGLEQYEEAFRENAIDDTVLPSLTAEDLKDLGVGIVGHRRKLLDAIAALRADASAKAPPPDALAAAGRPAKDSSERRPVTVMFSDLVDSTALSARMDPEDLREVISAYQKCVAEVVRSFDGFIAKYMGDGILVYFGYPEAHEDDAERAVRAGLELTAAVTGLKTLASLKARVGIATGLVVVGDLIGSGDAQERGIVGETPNLAARLQGIAEPNMVVIAESTRRLLGNLFELQDLGAGNLKGIAGPARAWAALRASSVESRFEALHASVLTPLVGREEEIELLLRRWSKSKAGDGQVVLLSGEAGIGKSRLTAAFLACLAGESYVRLRYFCSPQHTDSALYPIVGQMRRAAGLAHDDTPQTRLDKLDAVLAQTSTTAQDAALFAEMLSLQNDGRYPALDPRPQQRRQKTLEALNVQLEALSRINPVLMVLDDAHWSDPTSLEVFSRAVDRIATIRVLLLVTFRPEFDPPWIGRPHVTTLTINRLGQREVRAMIDRVVGNTLLPARIRHDIVERSDGIPLFVEEMTKAVLETGGEAQRTAAAAPSPALAVPASLHASLMARLDRLGSAKEVAQIGAAIGREFSHALLTEVVGMREAELAPALDRLIATGLLFRQGAPPQATYLFKHALVRDAAYGSLLREPRRALHLRIALKLEERFPTIADSQPEILAHHFAEADRIEKSAIYRLRAGKNAAARSANIEAISHFQKGIEAVSRLPDGPSKDRLELDLQFALGPCLIATRGAIPGEAVTTFARARELCRRLGNPAEYPQIMHWLTVMHAQRGELLEALETATTAVELAEASGRRPAVLNSTRGRGLVLLMLGRLVDARRVMERNIAEFEACDEIEKLATRAAGQDAGAAGLSVAAWCLWALGHADLAAARIAAAMRRADAAEHPHTLAYASYYASVLHALRREPEVACSHAERCLALSEEHGFGIWLALASAVRWSCASLRNPVAYSDATMHRELGGYAGAEHQLGITAVYVLLSEALLNRGELTFASGVISRGLATVERTGERIFEAELLRLRARALMAEGAAGAAANAQIVLDKALATARSQHARSLELRVGRDVADLWRDQGKQEEARHLLAPIYGWFTEGFDTLDLKQAKAVLDGLAP